MRGFIRVEAFLATSLRNEASVQAAKKRCAEMLGHWTVGKFDGTLCESATALCAQEGYRQLATKRH